jgi:hypothetical protein
MLKQHPFMKFIRARVILQPLLRYLHREKRFSRVSVCEADQKPALGTLGQGFSGATDLAKC